MAHYLRPDILLNRGVLWILAIVPLQRGLAAGRRCRLMDFANKSDNKAAVLLEAFGEQAAEFEVHALAKGGAAVVDEQGSGVVKQCHNESINGDPAAHEVQLTEADCASRVQFRPQALA